MTVGELETTVKANLQEGQFAVVSVFSQNYSEQNYFPVVYVLYRAKWGAPEGENQIWIVNAWNVWNKRNNENLQEVYSEARIPLSVFERGMKEKFGVHGYGLFLQKQQ
jgi:hypothetical protein